MSAAGRGREWVKAGSAEGAVEGVLPSPSVGLRVVGPITGFSRASLVLRTAALQQGKAERESRV